MSDSTVLSVRNLGKSYAISHGRQQFTTLAESLISKLKSPFQRPEMETFWAVKDVSFEINKGEVVGLIGRNGAGKSTLLKLLSRITAPTTGEIDVYGRVGSLLEVGTGFHQELTGRENIFLNGAILGMSRVEIRRRFDEIVDFAGVDNFVDTPVKRYSSGMYVRLAFAVAAHLDTEILLVDEVLAVGDLKFQEKCLGKMKDVAIGGRTVVFVSHSMAAVEVLCNRAIFMDAGTAPFMGEVASAVEMYLSHNRSSKAAAGDLRQRRRPGSGEYRFTHIAPQKNIYRGEEEKTIEFEIERAGNAVNGLYLAATIKNDLGVPLVVYDSRLLGKRVDDPNGLKANLSFARPWLKPGQYSVDIGIYGVTGPIDLCADACQFEIDPRIPFEHVVPPDAYEQSLVFGEFDWSFGAS